MNREARNQTKTIKRRIMITIALLNDSTNRDGKQHQDASNTYSTLATTNLYIDNNHEEKVQEMKQPVVKQYGDSTERSITSASTVIAQNQRQKQ